MDTENRQHETISEFFDNGILVGGKYLIRESGAGCPPYFHAHIVRIIPFFLAGCQYSRNTKLPGTTGVNGSLVIFLIL